MTSDKTPPPPRIHAILVSSAQVGVVFRRGPSGQVATFLWNRRKDEFKIGQWLKGRIYERRSDISPDGKNMIYFAMNGRWNSETGGAWTAVSKVPYLKALDLFAKGDCWEGGGLFVSNERYWLNDRHFDKALVLRSQSGLTCDPTAQPGQRFDVTCAGIYYPRLIREGWKIAEQSVRVRKKSPTMFDKPLAAGWILRKLTHQQSKPAEGKSASWDEHELINGDTGTRIRYPEWEWAEWEQGTLVWAERGKLYRALLASNKELGEAKLLHDFSSYSFESLIAPY